MQKGYFASDTDRRVLKYIPKREHCLPYRSDDTVQFPPELIVFLWLSDGKNGWYRVYDARGDTMTGYMLHDGIWHYLSLKKSWIQRYY
jgi:hypothetical protein